MPHIYLTKNALFHPSVVNPENYVFRFKFGVWIISFFKKNFRFPGVADLKVGDVYMIGNFFFVFGSLIEFALVNSLQRRKRKKKARKRKNSEIGDNRRTKPQKLEKIETVENGDFGQSDDELKAPDKLTFTQTSKKSRRSCVSCLRSVFKDVDRSALILFPICFVIWHICFLSFCVLNSTHQKFI